MLRQVSPGAPPRVPQLPRASAPVRVVELRDSVRGGNGDLTSALPSAGGTFISAQGQTICWYCALPRPFFASLRQVRSIVLGCKVRSPHRSLAVVEKLHESQ